MDRYYSSAENLHNYTLCHFMDNTTATDQSLGIAGGSGSPLYCQNLNNVHALQQLQQQQMQEMMNQQQQQINNQHLIFTNNKQKEASVFPAFYLEAHDVEKQNHDVEKQNHEIDTLLSLQKKRLNAVLNKQKKEQVGLILRRVEAKAENLSRQKDEEIVIAREKMIQLQNDIRNVEMEKQAWERAAKENEAMAMSINNTFQQVKEDHFCSSSSTITCSKSNGGAAGATAAAVCSCYCRCDEETEDKDSKKKMGCVTVCKGCGSCGSNCIVMLPCRHLCCCKACEPLLESCPMCNSPKNASIEVFMS